MNGWYGFGYNKVQPSIITTLLLQICMTQWCFRSMDTDLRKICKNWISRGRYQPLNELINYTYLDVYFIVLWDTTTVSVAIHRSDVSRDITRPHRKWCASVWNPPKTSWWNRHSIHPDMTTSGMPFRQVDTISRLKVGDIISFQFNHVSLPETNMEFTPENGWLEYYFPWDGPISGATRMLVSGSERFTKSKRTTHEWSPFWIHIDDGWLCQLDDFQLRCCGYFKEEFVSWGFWLWTISIIMGI